MWNNLTVYIILVQLWVAGEKAQPSSGHTRKRPYPSSSSYCSKSGRMSGMLVLGKNFSITYVMSDDIEDIHDPRYHMRRRTLF